jgi:hypothetical protein
MIFFNEDVKFAKKLCFYAKKIIKFLAKLKNKKPERNSRAFQ